MAWNEGGHTRFTSDPDFGEEGIRGGAKAAIDTAVNSDSEGTAGIGGPSTGLKFNIVCEQVDNGGFVVYLLDIHGVTRATAVAVSKRGIPKAVQSLVRHYVKFSMD